MRRSWIIAALLSVSLSAAEPAGAAQTPAWGTDLLEQDADWYATPEALGIARAVMAYQSDEGGWPKNLDLTQPVPDGGVDAGLANTFDNDGTTVPLAYLARVVSATGDDAARAAFERGLAYVFEAQYPNGGWPQFYPLRGGYYDHVTFNDDAMVLVLALLRDVASGAEPYGFVGEADRARAAQAVEAGVGLILRTQIRHDGALTGWCAQYDAGTLAPAWGRSYEPPSISGNESVGVIRFLMSLPDPAPEVIAAVDGAAAWLVAAALPDQRLETFTSPEGRPDRRLVAAPGDRIWARFYDLETGRPLFMGRDSVPHPRLEDIDSGRRNGYAYVGTWPERLIRVDYPAWRARVGALER